MAKTVKNTKKEISIEDENKSLKAEVEELKKMVSQLINKESEKKSKKVVKTEPTEEYTEIDYKKRIKIMSLTNHTLVLSTEGFGQGKVYTFKNFGEIKTIPYEDLSSIIHNQEHFIKNGKVYIMDRNVIINHDLQNEYDSILTKTDIENILELDKNEIKDVFKEASDFQKETIVSILVDKINKGNDVDLNKLHVINDIYGQDIMQVAKESIITQ